MGGAEYIARIATMGSSIINALDYAKIIFDLAKKRILIKYGEEIVNKAYESGLDHSAFDQIENAESGLFLLATEGHSQKDFVSQFLIKSFQEFYYPFLHLYSFSYY
jgi:replicative DNA helicase